MSNVLLIRADAGSRMGTGHMMRCLALGQAWQDVGGDVVFVMSSKNAWIEARLRVGKTRVEIISAEAGSAEDALATIAKAEVLDASWIVADGYQFNSEYQETLKSSNREVLWIDDYGHAAPYCADIVLNQNIYASEQLYEDREASTRLLLGTRYALLRREFRKWRGSKREIPKKARKILVTLGGGDPDNVTLKVIEGIERLHREGLEVRVLVGAANTHLDALRQTCGDASKNMEILSGVNDMPGLMAWANMAVSAGGSTCWEMAFMGLPNVIVVLADNQRLIAECLDKMGASIDLGWHESVSAESVTKTLASILDLQQQRIDMSEKGRNLVDGEGAERLCMILKGTKLRLRLVRDEDCRRLWEWANDPQVRSASYSTEIISWEDHVKWFDGVTSHPDCRIWIALDSKDQPVGQIRFEASGSREAKVGMSIDREYRELGYGSVVIDLGAQAMFAKTATQLLHAYIRQGNEASIRAFERSGFVEQGLETVSGVESHHYIRGRGDE